MAVLLLIGNDVVNEPYQYLDDVIGIFSDAHVFSQTELVQFNFLYVNGSREDMRDIFIQIKPKIALAFLWVADQKWHFQEPGEGEGEVAETADVWFDSPIRWRRLVNGFKFIVNVNNLTPEEKQLLETYDINHPSVGAFINKIVKDITSDPANSIEIRDLRGLEP